MWDWSRWTVRRKIPRYLKSQLYLSYYRMHFIYYLITTFVASLIVFGIETKYTKSSLLDCWFTTVSAHTVTGLGVVDYPAMSRITKSIVWVLICFGGQVAFALVPLLLRRFQYVWQSREKKRGWKDVVLIWSLHPPASACEQEVEEFRSVTLLAKIILCYGVFFNVLAFTMLIVYCYCDRSARGILAKAHIEPWQFATFHTVSAFNNAGFSLFSNSLEEFSEDPYVLLVSSMLIVTGNTLFPVLLRCFVWCLSKTRIGTRNPTIFATFLNTPRIYTTHLFNYHDTLMIFAVSFATTMFQFILYTFVPFHVESTPPTPFKYKVLQMFFTTISTRTAGFNAVNMDTLNPGILVLQVLLMYLASYPFIVAVKSTAKVKLNETDVENNSLVHAEYQTHATSEVKKTLSNDLLWLALAMWLIAITQRSMTIEQLFRLLFEVTSAYGNVGVSLSVSSNISSFVSGFQGIGKFIIIVIMLIGRHRGMPHSIDSAITSIKNNQEPSERVKRLVYKRTLTNLADNGYNNRFHTIGHAVEKPKGVAHMFDSDSNLKTRK